MKPKKKRGGARAGAGRKRRGNRLMCVRINPKVIAAIQANARLSGVTVGEAISQCFGYGEKQE